MQPTQLDPSGRGQRTPSCHLTSLAFHAGKPCQSTCSWKLAPLGCTATTVQHHSLRCHGTCSRSPGLGCCSPPCLPAMWHLNTRHQLQCGQHWQCWPPAPCQVGNSFWQWLGCILQWLQHGMVAAWQGCSVAQLNTWHKPQLWHKRSRRLGCKTGSRRLGWPWAHGKQSQPQMQHYANRLVCGAHTGRVVHMWHVATHCKNAMQHWNTTHSANLVLHDNVLQIPT